MSTPTLLDERLPADVPAALDDIVPYAGADAATCLQVLDVRRAVGEHWFARLEDLAIAEIHDVEAEAQEARARADGLSPLDRRRLVADAARNRTLADRARFRARHFELMILAHLRRKVG